MSALTPEQILALLKLPDKPPKKATGTRTRRKKSESLNERTTQVWFDWQKVKRTYKFRCENPDCKDPRDFGDVGRQCTITIKDIHICRYCFLDGYLKDEETDG